MADGGGAGSLLASDSPPPLGLSVLARRVRLRQAQPERAVEIVRSVLAGRLPAPGRLEACWRIDMGSLVSVHAERVTFPLPSPRSR